MFRQSLTFLAASPAFAAVLSQIQREGRVRTAPPPSTATPPPAAAADPEARRVLATLAHKHNAEFLQFAQTCNIEVLTMTVLVAGRAGVKPEGQFIESTLVPALEKRYYTNPASAPSSASSLQRVPPQKLVKQAKKESILLRRLCELHVFRSTAKLRSKKKLLLNMTSRLCDLFSQQQQQQQQQQANDMRGDSSTLTTITTVNHAICALAEAAENASGDDGSKALLLAAAIRVMNSGCLSCSSSSSSNNNTAVPNEDVFQLVRILRHTVGLLPLVANGAVSVDPAQPKMVLSHFTDVTRFCLTVVRLLCLPCSIAALRGSHTVTVLQACAKLSSTRTAHPLLFVDSGAVLSETSKLAAAVVASMSKRQQAETTPTTTTAATTTTAKSSCSSLWFDTTPAALCKVARSIATLRTSSMTATATDNNDATLLESYDAVSRRCMRAISQDVATSQEEHHRHSALSTVAWCELLTALRMHFRNRQQQQQHQVEEAVMLLRCFRQEVVRVFRRALEQDLPSATVILVSAVELRLQLGFGQIRELAAAVTTWQQQQQQQSSNGASPSALGLARQLSRLALRAARQQQQQEQQSDESVQQAILQLTISSLPVSEAAGVPLQLISDVTRNLFALGATVADCEPLLRFAADRCSSSSSVSSPPDAVRQLLRSACFAQIVAAPQHGEEDHDDVAQLSSLLEQRSAVLVHLIASPLLQDPPAFTLSFPALWSTLGECIVRCSLASSSNNKQQQQQQLAIVLRRVFALAALRLFWSGGAGQGKDAAALLRAASADASIFTAATELHKKASRSASAATRNADGDDADDDVGELFDENADSTLPWLQQSAKTAAAVQRTVAEELVFFALCLEHAFEGELTRGNPPARSGGGGMSIFQWASAGDPQVRVALVRAFNAALASIRDTLDLQNDVTSKLPFALSSRSLRASLPPSPVSVGDASSETSVVRRAVMNRVLAELAVDERNDGAAQVRGSCC